MASMKSGRWLMVRRMSGTLPARDRERMPAKASAVGPSASPSSIHFMRGIPPLPYPPPRARRSAAPPSTDVEDHLTVAVASPRFELGQRRSDRGLRQPHRSQDGDASPVIAKACPLVFAEVAAFRSLQSVKEGAPRRMAGHEWSGYGELGVVIHAGIQADPPAGDNALYKVTLTGGCPVAELGARDAGVTGAPNFSHKEPPEFGPEIPSEMTALLSPTLDARAYLAVIYCIARIPLAFFYLALISIGLSLSFSLIWVFGIGVPIFIALLLIIWWTVGFERELGAWWFGFHLRPMAISGSQASSWWTRLLAFLSNPVTWKSLAFAVVQIPVGFAIGVGLLAGLALAVGMIAAPFLYSFSAVSAQPGDPAYNAFGLGESAATLPLLVLVGALA